MNMKEKEMNEKIEAVKAILNDGDIKAKYEALIEKTINELADSLKCVGTDERFCHGVDALAVLISFWEEVRNAPKSHKADRIGCPDDLDVVLFAEKIAKKTKETARHYSSIYGEEKQDA